jgi:hypothetical protein
MKANLGLEMDAQGQMEDIALAVVSMIRQESEAGRLISNSDILHRLADRGRDPLREEEFGGRMKDVLNANEDLHEISAGNDSRHFYSSLFMTASYATILLRKQGDPLRLIAETVRQNSVEYSRPVPLDLFTRPPFGLTRREVLDNLERMEAREEYRDIAQTTTSASSVFLYSALHLEPGHASMLAEWLDVGQFDNP